MRPTAKLTMAVMTFAAILAPPGLGAQAVTAQERPASAGLGNAGLEREVRALNETLRELVGLLERQLESSNAAVLMQRVQLMTSRIAPLVEELQTVRADQNRLQRELDEVEMSSSSFESQLERQVESGELTAEEARQFLDGQRPLVEERRKQLEDRLWEVQQRVIDLEQRLNARRGELETWEGEIDRSLGLR